MIDKLRNIAIIAHVDHGKTTLVDCLLRQSGTLDRRDQGAERVMDSNDQERERGITILAKNTAITWNDYRINIVDTPGHADFGGEVERVLSMVDAVLLLVDAVDGPMPQTRFVTSKAFDQRLNPIVVVNKIDRPGARPDWVVDQMFDLFDRLDATEEQLDFPVIYASALIGFAMLDLDNPSTDMRPLFDTIIKHVAPPTGDPDEPLQLQISALDYSSFVGRIGIGRITRGRLKPGQDVMVLTGDKTAKKARVNQVLGFEGIERVQMTEALAGDIVLINGVEELSIGTTVADINQPGEGRSKFTVLIEHINNLTESIQPPDEDVKLELVEVDTTDEVVTCDQSTARLSYRNSCRPLIRIQIFQSVEIAPKVYSTLFGEVCLG